MDLTDFTARCERYALEKADAFRDLPDLSILRRESESDIEAVVYEPVVCLILQGAKVTAIGDQVVELTPGNALLVSHTLPVVSRITRASPHAPYLAAILALDLGLVRSLYEQIAEAHQPGAPGRPLSVGPAEPAWVAPLIRYVDLLDNPLDAQVLGAAIRREIHYRLLLSPLGGALRELLLADSHASRIAKAIHKLQAEFRAALSVTELAQAAGMSPSSFHEHFKKVTGTTPLQYQKDLRLIEARSLLGDRARSVSEAAFSVGYESPTHFSRDYSRKFGVPPSRDATGPGSADRAVAAG